MCIMCQVEDRKDKNTIRWEDKKRRENDNIESLESHFILAKEIWEREGGGGKKKR